MGEFDGLNRALDATLSQAFGPPEDGGTPTLGSNLLGPLFLVVLALAAFLAEVPR